MSNINFLSELNNNSSAPKLLLLLLTDSYYNDEGVDFTKTKQLTDSIYTLLADLESLQTEVNTDLEVFVIVALQSLSLNRLTSFYHAINLDCTDHSEQKDIDEFLLNLEKGLVKYEGRKIADGTEITVDDWLKSTFFTKALSFVPESIDLQDQGSEFIVILAAELVSQFSLVTWSADFVIPMRDKLRYLISQAFNSTQLPKQYIQDWIRDQIHIFSVYDKVPQDQENIDALISQFRYALFNLDVFDGKQFTTSKFGGSLIEKLINSFLQFLSTIVERGHKFSSSQLTTLEQALQEVKIEEILIQHSDLNRYLPSIFIFLAKQEALDLSKRINLLVLATKCCEIVMKEYNSFQNYPEQTALGGGRYEENYYFKAKRQYEEAELLLNILKSGGEIG